MTKWYYDRLQSMMKYSKTRERKYRKLLKEIKQYFSEQTFTEKRRQFEFDISEVLKEKGKHDRIVKAKGLKS